MAIRFECDRCGSVLKIKDDLAGKPGKCPKCKTPFTVPSAESEAEVEVPSEASLSDDSDSSEQEPTSNSGGGDFDVDAFLLSDDPGSSPSKSKKSSAKSPKVADDDESASLSDDSDARKPSQGKSSSKSSGSTDDSDTFKIRRKETSATGKSKPSLPPDLDETSDNASDGDAPVAASRRPPGTSASANAANFASDLLSKSGKKGKRANWSEAEAQAKADRDPSFDWRGLSQYLGTRILPIVLGGIVGVWLLYSLVNSSMRERSFVPDLGTVKGSVKFNGKPLVGVEVWFHPIREEDSKQEKKRRSVSSSTGITDMDGNYELTYSANHKGAVVGDCRIEVVAITRTDIPEKYRGTESKEVREVKPGRQVIDFELSN